MADEIVYNSGRDAIQMDSSGNIQMGTGCVCCAPCDCPCAGTWPPASWPCGGLVESYDVSFTWTGYDTYNCTGNDTSCSATITVSADSAGSCVWAGTDSSSYCSPFQVVLGLSQECEWSAELTSNKFALPTVQKATGSTPVGGYGSSECANSPFFPGSETFTSVTVAEST